MQVITIKELVIVFVLSVIYKIYVATIAELVWRQLKGEKNMRSIIALLSNQLAKQTVPIWNADFATQPS